MAERLNNIAYSQSHPVNTGNSAHFNPRSVSLDIRTPEELAAVNEFLLTLGRDVSSITDHSQSHSGSMDPVSAEAYFDPVTLFQMGIAGMPGLPAADDFNIYAGASSQYTSPNAQYQRRPSTPPHNSEVSSIYQYTVYTE